MHKDMIYIITVCSLQPILNTYYIHSSADICRSSLEIKQLKTQLTKDGAHRLTSHQPIDSQIGGKVFIS